MDMSRREQCSHFKAVADESTSFGNPIKRLTWDVQRIVLHSPELFDYAISIEFFCYSLPCGLPFSASLVSAYPHVSAAAAIYLGNMIALPSLNYAMWRYGSLADKPSRAKTHLCPLWSKSGQTRAQLDCPLCAKSGLMHRSKMYLYSITSSARASNVGGTVRPSALAVLRLMTSWNLVGCSTGRSAGLAPLRILSTKTAVRRNWFKRFDP
jgi:hypothetical protein